VEVVAINLDGFTNTVQTLISRIARTKRMLACEFHPALRFQSVDSVASPGLHVPLVKHFNFAKHRKTGSKMIIPLVKIVDFMALSSAPDYSKIDVADAGYPSTKSIATMNVDPNDTFVAFRQPTESFGRNVIGKPVDRVENGPVAGPAHYIYGHLKEPAIHVWR
jgi:hypothetical protein